MTRLTADLIQLSKVENEQEIALERLDLVGAVAGWCEPLAAVAEQKGVEFVLDLPTGPCWVRANRPLLGRAFVNMVENGLKFTAAGEGKVTVSLSSSITGVVLCVADNGIGLGDEPEKLFERFYRAPQARTYAGSGLGLAIAQRIVKLHGGDVSAEELEVGALFRVSLPIYF